MSKIGWMDRKTIGVDFDGVIHSSPDWTPVDQEVDVTLIRELHKAGYAVAVITANDVSRVGKSLRDAGIRVQVDERMVNRSWRGGKDGRLVLITNRKIAATAYVDDRALRWSYGGKVSDVTRELAYRTGFKACAQARHWGPYGAAGVVPYVVADGRVKVLVGKRSWSVAQPRTWGGFGGALERGEKPWEGAVRELGEEVTISLNAKTDYHAVRYVYTWKCECCGWTYTTFLVELDGRHGVPDVRIADRHETDLILWEEVGDVASRQLHPGFVPAWPEFRKYLRLEYPQETKYVPRPELVQAELPLFREPEWHEPRGNRDDELEPDIWDLHKGVWGEQDDQADNWTDEGEADWLESLDGQELADYLKREYGAEFPVPDDQLASYLQNNPGAWREFLGK